MRSLPIVVLTVALGTAACGGGSKASTPTTAAAAPTKAAAKPTSGGGSAAGDPCALVSADEVKGIFGGTVSGGKPLATGALALPTCHFTVMGSNLGGDGSVVVAILTSLSDPTRFGYAKKGAPSAVDVPGVGDSAFYTPIVSSLDFIKGGKAIMVQGIFGIGGPKPAADKIKGEIVSLAGKVAGKV